MHTQRGKTEGDRKEGGMGRDGGPGEMGKGEREEKRERKGGGEAFWISAITKLTDPVRCISPISSLFIGKQS